MWNHHSTFHRNPKNPHRNWNLHWSNRIKTKIETNWKRHTEKRTEIVIERIWDLVEHNILSSKLFRNKRDTKMCMWLQPTLSSESSEKGFSYQFPFPPVPVSRSMLFIQNSTWQHAIDVKQFCFTSSLRQFPLLPALLSIALLCSDTVVCTVRSMATSAQAKAHSNSPQFEYSRKTNWTGT